MTKHEPNRVVGVDPGGTTGLVLMVDGDLVEAATMPSREYVSLLEWIRDREPEVIVAEDFRGGHGAVNYEPLEVLGLLRYLSAVLHVPLVLQSPSILRAMRTRHAEQLTSGEHKREAHAHALHYWLTR